MYFVWTHRVYLIGHQYCSKYRVPRGGQHGLYREGVDVPILGLSHFVHARSFYFYVV
jgi:hypothetical protein